MERSQNAGRLTVAGIGASAGGLEAFQQLLKKLPADTGKAFVLIQHLDPSHKSSLREILSGYTLMPVCEAKADIRLEADHVYVIPSDHYATVSNGTLQLTNREQATDTHYPIDLFFQSLAEEYQEGALGVILSGSGSDGTIGLRAIKSHGGITFAQNEQSAKYRDMPRNAAIAGDADFILPPDKIAEQLGKLIPRSLPHPSAAAGQQSFEHQTQDSGVEEVFKIMLSNGRIDLSNYQRSSVERRILRRMSLLGKHRMSDYLDYLGNSPSEAAELYEDIFIHVTSFFREPAKYDFLMKEVLPGIINQKSNSGAIRLWVAGCSTGEEVYSIAITILEFLGKKAAETRVQIFASDISQTVIERARAGIYPKSIEQDVAPARLTRFFSKLEHAYQVNKEVRELCVFAKHDLTADPPFSRLDVISCCNVLIYFTHDTQSNILNAFHYALKPSGYLLLGKSESARMRSDLFHPLEKNAHVLTKKDGAIRSLPNFSSRIARSMQMEYKKPERLPAAFDIQKEADRLALAEYEHRGFVIDEEYRILQFRGDVSAFLQPVAGTAILSLDKMVREDLWLPLRSMVEKAKKKHVAQKKRITLTIHKHLIDIRLDVLPIQDPNSPEYFYLITLDDSRRKQRENKTALTRQTENIIQADKDRYIASLKSQLADAKDYIRSHTKEREAVIEKLNFYNEELQSGNEELQSLNEELETSKEELESSCEEVTTLNEELQNRNRQLQELNQKLEELSEYSQSIIRTMREPFLVLNPDLTVKTANEAFFRTFKVQKSEVEGLGLYDFNNGQWGIPALRQMMDKLLYKHEGFQDFEIEHEFDAMGRRVMSLNGRRIEGRKGEAELILLAIQDITHQKALDAAMEIKLSEIHHRVKNNLQVISSLLSLHAKNLKDPAASKLLEDSRNRIRSVALIHEKLHLSGQPSKIAFKQYSLNLAEDLFSAFNVDKDKIGLSVDMDDSYLNLDKALPCALIVNELLSNCLLHAFKAVDHGEVRIKMKLEGNGVEQLYNLAVSDNGSGLPTEIDIDQSESMGIKIVRILSRQIGGTVRVLRDNGTTFHIQFPA